MEVNRPDRSTRRRIGKDDTIDAEAAARAYIAGTAAVIPKAGDDLGGLRSGEITTPLAAAKMTLHTLARRIQQLDQELKETVAPLDRLTMQLCPELRHTYGVGVDISATLVVAVGDNQERMKSEASFAALCGVNPLPASSGKVVRHRLNRSGISRPGSTSRGVPPKAAR